MNTLVTGSPGRSRTDFPMIHLVAGKCVWSVRPSTLCTISTVQSLGEVEQIIVGYCAPSTCVVHQQPADYEWARIRLTFLKVHLHSIIKSL